MIEMDNYLPQIHIAAHPVARNMLTQEPGKYHLIITHYSDQCPPEGLEPLAKSSLWFNFDDTIFNYPNLVTPTAEHVKTFVEWAMDVPADGHTGPFAPMKSPLVCSCNGGCSRSSAMAYVIACAVTSCPKL